MLKITSAPSFEIQPLSESLRSELCVLGWKGFEPGGDIQAIGRLGENALGWAIRLENDDWIEPLILAGLNLNHESSHGKTPLMQAMVGNSKELVEMLLKYGADINYQSCITGANALMFAVLYNPNIIFKFLEHGASLECKDNLNRTVWDYLDFASPKAAKISRNEINRFQAEKEKEKLKSALPESIKRTIVSRI